jgi:RecB family exonuclease
LQEVELACGPGQIHRTERADLSPIPAGDEPLTPADFRVKALANAMAGNVLLLAGLVGAESTPDRAAAMPAGVADNILAALGLLHQRQQREGFGAAEGMLLSDSARAALTTHFSPQRTFSATELERYAACPYRFFLENVVRLTPVEELALALDYLARGRKTHELLAVFHRRINGDRGCPTSPTALDDAQCQTLLRETLDAMFAAPAGGPVQAALAEVDRRLLLRWIGNYRRQHEVYDKLWDGFASPPRPTHFEISFGRPVSGQNDPASLPQPLELGDGRVTVRLSGSIDRIDLGIVGGQPVFNILDYKTGAVSQFSPEAVARGHSLQLPIYAIAAEQLLLAPQRAMPWQAGYWQVKDSGYKSKQSLRMAANLDGQPAAEPSWQALREVVVQTVLALVQGMRQGQFPVYNEDPNCTGHCPYRTVCRINQIRSLEKTWQPPSVGN